MWSISNINLPVTVNTKPEKNGSYISTLKPTTSLTGSGGIATLFSNIITKIATVTQVGTGIYTVAVTSDPQTIEASGTVFYPATDPENPQSGEFVYVNGQIIVYSDSPITTVKYFSKPSSIQNLIAKGVTGLSGLNVVGQISINDSFQDHPSANMSLICRQQDLGQLRNRFAPGTFVNLCGFSFIVNNYSESINRDDASASIGVSLRGKWEMYANKAISLNKPNSATTNDFQDPECQVDYVATNKKKYISINELASRVGSRVLGISFDIEIPNTSDNSNTTINNELSNWLDIKKGFLSYSDPSAIVFKTLDNVRTFSYTDFNILSDFNTSINRLPEVPQSRYLYLPPSVNFNALVPATITSNTVSIQAENTNAIPRPAIQNYTTPDIFNDAGKVITEPTTQQESKYELRKVVRSRRTTGDPDPTSPPTSITKISTLDLNFDRSGATKTTIDIEEEDGMPIREITKRYGFAYTSWDITKMLDVPGQLEQAPVLEETNPSTYWVLIEKTYKEYQYDEDTGYLLGYTLTGTKLLRANIEGDDLYTQLYNLALNDAEVPDSYQTALYNSYLFEYVPVYGAKRYLLAAHRNYYEKFESDEQYIKKCAKDGTSYYERNPNYIESLFAIAETEEYSCYISKNNPGNYQRDDPEAPYLPPLTAGIDTFNRQFITILPSQNSNPGFVKSIDAPTEDRYQTYSSNFSAQDANFASVAEQTNVSESTGVPPVHTRKPPKYELVEKKVDAKKEKNFRYVFWTSPYTGGYPRTGSYSFDKAKNIQEVENAVINQLRLDDIRSTLSSSCTVPLDLSIRSGDKAIINIKGAVFRRRIMTATHNLTIQGVDQSGRPYITSDGTQLSLGLERPITINTKKEKVEVTQKKTNVQLTYIYDADFKMGSLLDSDLPRRGRA